MTTDGTRTPAPARRSPAGDAGRVAAGVLPWTGCWVLAVVLAHQVGGYAVGDLLRFTAYVAAHLTLTGTVLLRWATRGGVTRTRASLPGELALGTATGLLAESLAYAAALGLGHPHAVLLWPVLVLGPALGRLVVRTARRRRSAGTAPTDPVPARSVVPSGAGLATGAALALLTAWVVVRVAADQWLVHPDTLASLRAPYVDEQFHLALVGELRHHLPPQVPYVLGTPLGYHWLWYVHVAAASWVTGSEPVALVRGLDPAFLLVLTGLGTAEVASRLVPGRSRVAGVVALVVLLGVTPGFLGWAPWDAPSGWPASAARAFLSPTFVHALPITLLALLLLHLLVTGPGPEVGTGGARDPRVVAGWVVLLPVLVAVGAAKSSSLPPLGAGLVAVAGVRTLLAVHGRVGRRRVEDHDGAARAAALRAWVAVGLAGVAFVVDRQVFWGSGNRSLVLDPLQTLVRSARSLPGLAPAPGDTGGPAAVVLAALGLVFVVAKLAPAVGGLGLLLAPRREHAAPGASRVSAVSPTSWATQVSGTPLLLAATLLAGVGATLVLDHVALSQYYFTWSVLVLAPLLSGAGVAAALRRATGTDRDDDRGDDRGDEEGAHAGRRALRDLLLVAAGVAVLAAGWTLVVHGLAPASTDPGPVGSPSSPAGRAVRSVLLPELVGCAGLVLLAVLGARARSRLAGDRSDRAGRTRAAVVVLLLAAVVGSGSVAAAAEVPGLLRGARGDRSSVTSPAMLVRPGGIAAARWLRTHSDPDDVVATNVHCRSPRGTLPGCDVRSFWASGYAERRFLVEGWAYVSPSTVGLPSTPLTDSVRTPFWDPPRLEANDRAFRAPTAAALTTLRREYAVRWLLVDRGARDGGRGPDLATLERLADPVFAEGAFVVLRLR